jgi:glycosyltransferase involved in cell wall biosynthesis
MGKIERICWASDYEGIGNAYGYTTHMKAMKKHVGELVEYDNDAPIAMHITTGDTFFPIEGKKNYLFTMFEGERVPDTFIAGTRKADHIIVPCRQNKRVYEQYIYDIPIDVCHEGCDVDFYQYRERKMPKGKPFRFLWVGAPNPRKGYEEIIIAWKWSGADTNPNVELYIKTTMTGKVEQLKNVVWDSRDFTLEGLRDLYYDSHCFLFPTRSEGWGLTLTEAMATGLPSIATGYSGPADFFDSYVGYPIDYKLQHYYLEHYNLHTEMAAPSIDHMIELMSHVVNNYKEARIKARKAAERIRHKFTWQKAAQRLVQILEDSNG